MKSIRLFAIFTASICSTMTLVAATVTETVTVSGAAMPWLWNNTTLNPLFHFGIQDGTLPTIVDSSQGLSFDPGGTFIITYLSGFTNADTLTGSSWVSANG